eukprot:CAMPEP_0170080602 /NCGR_PEP_ID=MMETSP0019_2-20121128/16703_1 /TAXON_ID=98059 /ORGANISM="Dinobryon sp., Strain UTEXLB2267" /LENGTH=309 /DNA_ID=CAMNT_0010294663 /DNA_START=125 /DNA_END=1051 /DNA_ORIENTATION=+
MNLTCCPQYSIRLEISRFHPSKKQRKVLKKLNSIKVPETVTNSSTLQSSKASEDSDELTITLEIASFSVEKFNLYKKYQVSVHTKPSESYTEESFTSFLVTSPLFNDSNRNIPFGTMHQLYRLNNTLIAVGVLDILPSGVSSVYFFYDVDYKHLSLGKYSALKEIELCQTLGLQYYYMGFYIHSCEKMKYKAEYKPSELLCPTSLEWIPLDKCIPILDKFSFSPLREDLALEREAIETTASSSESQKMDIEVSENERRSKVKKLAVFAPRFPENISIESIRLLLNSREVFLRDITPRGQQYLRPLLKKW